MDIYIVRALDDSAKYRAMGKVPPSEYPPPVTRYLGANGWWATDIRLAARFPDRDHAAKARARSVLEDSDLAIEAEIAPLPEVPTADIDKAWTEAEARLDVDVGYQLAVVRQEDGTYAAVEITNRPISPFEAYTMSEETRKGVALGTPYTPSRLTGTVHGTGHTLPDLLASLGRPMATTETP